MGNSYRMTFICHVQRALKKYPEWKFICRPRWTANKSPEKILHALSSTMWAGQSWREEINYEMWKNSLLWGHKGFILAQNWNDTLCRTGWSGSWFIFCAAREPRYASDTMSSWQNEKSFWASVEARRILRSRIWVEFLGKHSSIADIQTVIMWVARQLRLVSHQNFPRICTETIAISINQLTQSR